jgi:hypothetical protein
MVSDNGIKHINHLSETLSSIPSNNNNPTPQDGQDRYREKSNSSMEKINITDLDGKININGQIKPQQLIQSTNIKSLNQLDSFNHCFAAEQRVLDSGLHENPKTDLYGNFLPFSPEINETTMNQHEMNLDTVRIVKEDNNTLIPFKSHQVFVETVDNNLSKFTKRQVHMAEEAKKLYSKLGRPSLKDFIQLIRTNGVKNCPISVEDINRAITIWGQDLGSVIGKTIRKTPKSISDDLLIRHQTDYTNLYVDILFINQLAFILTISKGYNLLVVKYIDDRKKDSVEKAIKDCIAAYQKYNVKVTMILSDGEGAIGALKQSLESDGIAVEQASKNEHVPIIERAIRQVKERVRAYINTLPFKLTKEMLIYLVYFLVSMINSFPRSTSALEGVAPKTKLTGKTLDYNHDLKLEFGDYAQVNEENNKTNSMEARTFPGICLGTVGNIQGSYYFMNLNTWQVVKRRSWVQMPLPNHVIENINSKTERELNSYGSGVNRFRINNTEIFQDDDLADENQVELPIEELNADQPIQEPPSQERPEVDYEPHYFYEEPEEEEFEEVDPQPQQQQPEPEPSHKYNLRNTPQRQKWKEKFGFTLWGLPVLTTYSVKNGIKEFGAEAIDSMKKEMNQLHQKGVFEPVKYSELTNKQKVRMLRSLMFLKRKRNNILKSRFVANGSMQIRMMSAVDPSSPTVSTEALFITAAIDAVERRYIATVDIEGAYLHAKMLGEVLMKIDPVIAQILVTIDPIYKNYLLPDGSLAVRLNKALYGCIESARLFYENISKALEDYGFVKNSYDPCVFNKIMYGKQCTIVIHVDDLKISCADRRGVDDVINELTRVYGNINVHREDVVDYLGMDFDYSNPGVVKISMTAMVDQVIEELQVSEKVRTPAANDLFHVDEKSELLEKERKEKFHSLVAKLLYMAKRARPDILAAVSFLTTRCQVSTEQDWNKLLRIAYLFGTRELALSLAADNQFKINTYIDASFACHIDGKSHTGEVITLGKGAVFSRSSKQKLVSKSSTEAELVGLSDGLTQVLWTKNFLQSQGYDTGPAIVHQDNKSTITLAEKGRSTNNRTRHISIRYFFVKDRIESKDIRVTYTGTDEMMADFLSKPLQGHAFEKHRNSIMNIT